MTFSTFFSAASCSSSSWALGDGAAGGRNDLVVVLDFLTLIHKRAHSLLATFVDEDGSNLKKGLGMEILLGISDSEGGIDVASDDLEDRGIASDHHIRGQLRHFLCGGAGGCGDREDGHSQDFNCFSHK